VHRFTAWWRWNIFCPHCKPGHQGRFFKKPDEQDLAKFQRAHDELNAHRSQFVPVEDIPLRDESTRLHRWGYRKYRKLFNARQLLGLELSCRYIAACPRGR